MQVTHSSSPFPPNTHQIPLPPPNTRPFWRVRQVGVEAQETPGDSSEENQYHVQHLVMAWTPCTTLVKQWHRRRQAVRHTAQTDRHTSPWRGGGGGGGREREVCGMQTVARAHAHTHTHTRTHTHTHIIHTPM